MAFVKATKEKLKLRMALFAPSGGGKTYTALKFAKRFGSIAYIDTENRSSCKYIGEEGIPEFDIATLEYHGDAARYIQRLIDTIYEARGYDIIVIDSLTHAWDACKDEVDKVAKTKRTANTFAAWREGNTHWAQLIDVLINNQTNCICCARSKMEYVQDKNDSGKTEI